MSTDIIAPITQNNQDRPVALPVVFDNIPPALRDRRRWVLWRYEQNGPKKWTKVLYNPHVFYEPVEYKKAATDNPKTWGSFMQVANILNKHPEQIDGIGFVLVAADKIVGLDLDGTRDTRHEAAILKATESYAERSPSGNGLRIIGFGEMPNNLGRKAGWLEMYNDKRFLTITGQVLDGHTTVNVIQPAVNALMTKYFPVSSATSTPPPSVSLSHDDNEVIGLCRGFSNGDKFQALWEADEKKLVTEYGYAKTDGSGELDHSRADAALCSILAFVTKDANQIEQLVSASKLGQWDKWSGRADYRKRTIESAIANCADTYKPTVVLDDVEVPPFPEIIPDIDTTSPTATPKPAGRRGMSAMDVMNLPAPEWVIQKHCQTNSLNILAGPPGVGKSYWALDSALTMATGGTFLGKFRTKPKTVAYIYSEGVSGIKYRLQAWQRAHGVTDVGERIRWYPYRYDFLNPDDLRDFLIQSREDFGAPPGVVIVDTVARNFGGGDENSTKDMNLFVAGADYVRGADSLMWMVHHTGKDLGKGGRGSSALPGAADNIFYMDPCEPGFVTVRNEKMKDGTPPSSYRLKFVPHVLGVDADGDEITSASLEYDGTVSEFNVATTRADASDQFASLTFPTTVSQAATVWGMTRAGAEKRLDKGVTFGLLTKTEGTKIPPVPAVWTRVTTP